MFVFHLVRVHFSLVRFRLHSFTVIYVSVCSYLHTSALTCTRLPFACIRLHTFMPVCFQPLLCVYFCAFLFTLTCSYLYTDWLSPIGFFFHLYASVSPTSPSALVCAHPHLFVLVHAHSYSPVLVCACSCSPALICALLRLFMLASTGTRRYHSLLWPPTPILTNRPHIHSLALISYSRLCFH